MFNAKLYFGGSTSTGMASSNNKLVQNNDYELVLHFVQFSLKFQLVEVCRSNYLNPTWQMMLYFEMAIINLI